MTVYVRTDLNLESKDKIKVTHKLFLLNKDNRGYISPLEYNQYAKLAQLEIFESLYSKIDTGKVDIFR